MMRVSTIIPAYNRADLIGETLHSVLSQSRAPAEVIVVDDGSTDGTPDVVAAYGKAVTLLRQANAGAGPARNAGLARSSGEIVHFMDSDDVVSLNSYKVQVAAIESGADFVYGPWWKTRFDDRLLSPEPRVLQQRPIPAGTRMDRATLLLNWVTVFQPCLFRRTLIDAAGPYRTDLKPSEDTEMLYRISRLAPRMAHSAETILLYRVHPENQVSEQNRVARALDHARLWLIFADHAARDGLLDRRGRLALRQAKLRAARAVRTSAPDIADALEHDVTAVVRALHAPTRLIRRIHSRLRLMANGSAYATIFQAAGPTAEQLSEIARLGYRL